MLQSIPKSLFTAVASLALLASAGARAQTTPDKPASQTAPKQAPTQRQLVEKQLQEARARLEAAAREVARLSGELTGPAAYDRYVTHFLSARRSAMLGVGVENDKDGKSGAVVQSVTPDGPAQKAGIQVGDVLVAVDGKSLENVEGGAVSALIEHMGQVKPGDKVSVEYRRDGRKHAAQVVATTAAFPSPVATLERLMRERRERDGGGDGVAPPQQGQSAPGMMWLERFIGPDVLDMELVTLTPGLGRYFGAGRGVLVIRPPRDAALKLQEGDVILDIDGREPQSGVHAMRILRSYQPGESMTLTVMRDRKNQKLAATLPTRADRPKIESPPRTFRIPPPPPPEERT
jgi:S1-C subfamily serine protease